MRTSNLGFTAVKVGSPNRTAFLCLFFLIVSILSCVCLSSCSPKKAISQAEATSETTIPPTPTPEPTSTPTPTPTVTPTPTPSPIPTPVPQYIEPEFEEEIWYNGFVDGRSVRATIIENPDDITAVVNKYYAIPPDYVPSDLVSAPNSYDQQLRAEANDAWIQMSADCLEETGRGLFLVSGYRTNETQSFLFYRSLNLRGAAFAAQKNAVPGRSEHQLGLALDITPAGVSNIMDDFGQTTVGMWVDEHCYEYGLIRRYQEQYMYETGYGIEAWHYRYVGVEVATYLYENDMSLEAYMGMEQVLPWDE